MSNYTSSWKDNALVGSVLQLLHFCRQFGLGFTELALTLRLLLLHAIQLRLQLQEQSQ